MIQAGMNARRWCQMSGSVTIGLALVLTTGCEFGSEGAGSLPGLACYRDLKSTELLIDLTPYMDAFAPAGSSEESDSPSSGEFLVFDQTFAVEWHFAYDGYLPSGPAMFSPSYSYMTHIEIRQDGEVVWETDVASDPVEPQDEGWDSVVVEGGLPMGFYVVVVDLDPLGEVFECNDFGTVENNEIEMNLPVWGPNGPPQSPTPCQEAELPNCRD